MKSFHYYSYMIKMKLRERGIKGILAYFGNNIHLAQMNGWDLEIVEAESILFEKGMPPIEFHKRDDLHNTIKNQ